MNHEFDIENDHIGFEAPGQVVQTTDFDMKEVIERLGETELEPEDVRAEAAELLSRLFVFVWAKPCLKTALIKFSALTYGMRRDLLGGRTQPQLAAEIGACKASLSKSLARCEKTLGIRLRRVGTETGRNNMRDAMIESHQRRKEAA